MSSAHPEPRQKIQHELWEMTRLFLYLAFFFCALAYDLFLLKQYWNLGFALLNGLAITKVIMIGEHAKLGKMHADKAVFVSAAWKIFVFDLLVFDFHIVD